jgi:hypothetical protein
MLKGDPELRHFFAGASFDRQLHPAAFNDQPSELIAPGWLLQHTPANVWIPDAGAVGEARCKPAGETGPASESQRLAFALTELVAKRRAHGQVDGAQDPLGTPEADRL